MILSARNESWSARCEIYKHFNNFCILDGGDFRMTEAAMGAAALVEFLKP